MLLVSLSETVSSFQRMLHVSPLLPHSSIYTYKTVSCNLSRTISLCTDFAKTTTRLNSRASTRSLSFRFFSFYSQLRITLEKTVQSKFGLLVNSDLVRVRNELLAKTSGLRGHRCAEHHHPLLLGVSMKICRTSFCTSMLSKHLSHSSSTNCDSLSNFKSLSRRHDQVCRSRHAGNSPLALRDPSRWHSSIHGDSFHLEECNPHRQAVSSTHARTTPSKP